MRAGGWRMGGKIVKEKDGAGMLLENAGMAPPYITACDVMLQEYIYFMVYFLGRGWDGGGAK